MSLISKEEFEKQFKNKLIETFKFTIDYFERHNLCWWAAYGTCLGAIRHQGMIPWDDDIDIYMPRGDFNKLLSSASDFDDTDFGLLSLNDANCYSTCGKIYNKTTTFWNGRKSSIPMGLWIDIFPLDLTQMTSDTYKERFSVYQKIQYRYRLSSINYSMEDLWADIIHFHPNSIRDGLKSKFYYSLPKHKARVHKAMKDAAEMFNDGIGQFYFSPCAHEGIKELYKKEWFDGYQFKPFEDFTIRVPLMYEEYLAHYFGDYMTPPPYEKRIRHEVLYCNLMEQIDIDEIKKRIKNGIHMEG